ncbi:MAG: DUF4136 domain-containing protein [Polyangiaceae bacterium]
MRLLVLAFLASSACGGPPHASPPAPASATIHTMINPAASFDRYRTFSFGPEEGPPVGYRTAARSVDVRRRLRPLITAALTERGYVAANANANEKADFVVMYGSGLRDSSVHEESSVSAEWLPDDENADFVEGSLVIDAFDGTKGNRVWHGASRANINPDQLYDERLQRVVRELISAFPAARGAAP